MRQSNTLKQGYVILKIQEMSKIVETISYNIS